jgi:hypothetical protein
MHQKKSRASTSVSHQDVFSKHGASARNTRESGKLLGFNTKKRLRTIIFIGQ